MAQIVRFEIKVSRQMASGFWEQVYVGGSAEVIEYGFQTQLGREGYALKVLESAEYAAGTTIYAYSHSIRKVAA